MKTQMVMCVTKASLQHAVARKHKVQMLRKIANYNLTSISAGYHGKASSAFRLKYGIGAD